MVWCTWTKKSRHWATTTAARDLLDQSQTPLRRGAPDLGADMRYAAARCTKLQQKRAQTTLDTSFQIAALPVPARYKDVACAVKAPPHFAFGVEVLGMKPTRVLKIRAATARAITRTPEAEMWSSQDTDMHGVLGEARP